MRTVVINAHNYNAFYNTPLIWAYIVCIIYTQIIESSLWYLLLKRGPWPIELVFIAYSAWWRNQMETFSALLAICAGNLPVNSPHKGQWRGALMPSLICACINSCVNNRKAGDLRGHRTHCFVNVMDLVKLSYIRYPSTSFHAYVILPYLCTIHDLKLIQRE